MRLWSISWVFEIFRPLDPPPSLCTWNWTWALLYAKLEQGSRVKVGLRTFQAGVNPPPHPHFMWNLLELGFGANVGLRKCWAGGTPCNAKMDSSSGAKVGLTNFGTVARQIPCKARFFWVGEVGSLTCSCGIDFVCSHGIFTLVHEQAKHNTGCLITRAGASKCYLCRLDWLFLFSISRIHIKICSSYPGNTSWRKTRSQQSVMTHHLFPSIRFVFPKIFPDEGLCCVIFLHCLHDK